MNLMREALELFNQLGEKDAIIQGDGRSISFSKFSLQLHQVCNELSKLDIKQGDKILVLCPVEIDLYLIIGSIFKLGAVVVFVDPWASKDYIAKALGKVGPDHIIYSKKALPLVYGIPSIRKISKKFIKEAIIKNSSTNSTDSGSCIEVTGDTSALLTFTTGSTSSPKGFDRTHQFLLAQKKAHYDNFQHGDGPDLCMFPVFVLSNLANGVTSILADINLKKIKDASGEKLFNQITQNKVSSLTCSPALVKVIVDYCIPNAKNIPTLEYFYTGGAPVNPLLFEDLINVFPNASLKLVYGSTEAEPIAMMEGRELLEKTKELTLKGKGTVLGHVVEGLEYKIIRPKKEALTMYEEQSAGEIGEIILSGEFVGKKYYKSEIDFKKNKIVEGDKIWHRTGDHGVIREGVLYMMGRDNNQVADGERVIYPLEIEPVLDSLEYIERSCIFQYDLKNKISSILIQLRKGINYSDIIIPLNSKLKELGINPYKINFVSDMPVDPRHNSKIDIVEVKRIFSKESINELKAKNILSRFLMYCSERFPLIPSFLFVMLFSFDAFYLTQKSFGLDIISMSLNMVISGLVMFSLFFHLRLMDEFKDYDEDIIAYPERVLSRGIIGLSDFRIILGCMFLFECLASLYLGMASFIAWVCVFAYSILMYKEFFIPKFLKKRLSLYLVSHQLILPLMVIFLSQSLGDLTSFNVKYLISVFYITLISFYFEVSRKTWAVEMEKEGADSYTKVWGVTNTSYVLLLTALFQGALYTVLFFKYQFSVYTFIGFLFLLIFNIYTVIKFLVDSTVKNSKLVGLGGTIGLIIFHVLMIVSILN